MAIKQITDYPIIPALTVLQLKLQVGEINNKSLSVLKGPVFIGHIAQRAYVKSNSLSMNPLSWSLV